MKTVSLLTSALLASASFALAGGEGWMTDFEAAQKKAAAENKSLLIDFTGSDWCGWCIKLNEEVFQHEPFKTGVAENFILVELDYPRDKSKLSAEVIEQNDALKDRYGVRGFPTILLTDAEGRPFAKTGYQKGGPESYVTHLGELLKNKASRDSALQEAEKAEGLDKAMALYEALKIIPEDYHNQYPEVVKAIIANDPEDKTGLKADQTKKEATMKLEKDLRAAMQTKDTEKASGLIDAYVEKFQLTGSEKQQTLAMKINVYLATNDIDTAEKVIDEIVTVDPDSEFSKRLTNYKNTGLQKRRK